MWSQHISTLKILCQVTEASMVPLYQMSKTSKSKDTENRLVIVTDWGEGGVNSQLVWVFFLRSTKMF